MKNIVNMPKDSRYGFYEDNERYMLLERDDININRPREIYLKNHIEMLDVDYISRSLFSCILMNRRNLDSNIYELYEYDLSEYSNKNKKILLECENPIYKVKEGIYFCNSDYQSTLLEFADTFEYEINFKDYFEEPELKKINVEELEQDTLDISFCLGNGDIVHGIANFDSSCGFQMIPKVYIEKEQVIENLSTQEESITPSLWCRLLKETQYYQENREEIECPSFTSEITRQMLKEIILPKKTES